MKKNEWRNKVHDSRNQNVSDYFRKARKIVKKVHSKKERAFIKGIISKCDWDNFSNPRKYEVTDTYNID